MKRGKRPGRGALPAPPAATQVALDRALEPFGPRPARTQALPLLQAAQAAAGWLSPAVIAHVSRRTRLPVADLTGLATFYELLATAPRGETVIRVCDDIACSLDGQATALLAYLADSLGLRPGETSADGRFTLQTTACLGGCDRRPCLTVGEDFAGPAALAPGLLTAAAAPGRHGWLPGYSPRLLHRCGTYDPAAPPPGGMPALARARGLDPADVIAAVRAAGLVGRGGAAFPTALKWEACRAAPGRPKYIVLNADESEPGTYTNRKLLEDDPWLVLEGMAIAAHAIGADRGYAYVRGEYALAARRLQAAAAAATAAGWLAGFALEIRRGAGAYVCGEETALFASIEGYRGEPRAKPPFPTSSGLFGQPTVINNVETLACVPAIILHGPAAFAAAPPKLFAVSGHVHRPGVYEAPLGLPLRRLIDECGGGVTGAVQAVLMGGAAGTFLPPDQLDTPLDFASLKAAGASLGSGAVVVFNESVDLWQVGRRLARFFAEESCGKCVPCRLGTARQLELVEHMQAHGGGPQHLALLDDLAAAMADASICGLGQTAAAAVQSLIRQVGLPGPVPQGGAIPDD